MKKMIRLGAVGTAMIVAMGMSSAAMAAATAQSNATVEVLRPLQLENTADLDFGAIALNGSGTVALSTANVVTCSAGLVCTGNTSASEFRVFNGTGGKIVTISMPTAIDLVSQTPNANGTAAPENKIELTSFTTDAGQRTVTLAGVDTVVREVTLSNDAQAQASFKLGGTLTFDGSELAGVYTGTFGVTVEYS